MNSALLSLLDAANELKRLPRTGWLLAGVRPAESVADHSFATALLALALAETVNLDPQAQGLNAPLNVERVLRLALLHDLAESRITDLPKRAAHYLGREAKLAAEAAALVDILADSAFAQPWRAVHAEYAAATTPEARLVRDADKLEMAHQALHYAAQGHRTLGEFLHPPAFAFRASADFFTDLLARGESGIVQPD